MVKIKKNKKTKFQKDQVLCSKWNSYTLLAGMQTGMATLESSLAVSYKHAFNIRLAISLPEEIKTSVYSSMN